MSIIKGKKMNMGQVFSEDGRVVPVTIIQLSTESVDREIVNKPVSIAGFSKGKGFTGVMKRWNFTGQQATRGQSDKPRGPGSIGSQTPGRVRKGKKMAGRHGGRKVTVKGSKIVDVFPEKKQLMVLGPVPGSRNAQVIIKVL